MTDNISNIANRTERLKQIISDMIDIPVLVIGDIMLDRFVYGSVNRISPEGPIPVLSISRENMMLGGAGNALSSLAGLRVKGHIISVVGDDEAGKTVANLLAEQSISNENLCIDGQRPTTMKTRFLAGHQQLLRSDYEKNDNLNEKLEAECIAEAQALIPNVKAVLISDYGKGFLTHALLKAIIEEAKKHDLPIIVDPKGQDYSIYAGATAVTPNKKELSEATYYMPTDSDAEVLAAASKLIDECALDCVIATRSKDGISIIEKDAKEPTHLRTAALDVFDVSGAGDVVIATITAALAAGASMVEAGMLANIAGGIAVSKVGTTPIRAKELIDALDDDQTQNHIMPATERSFAERIFAAPTCDWDEASEQVGRWRARGLKVGFTNGCFDIVHKGHVSYLNEARSHCDRLVIGLNKDSSVKALKGPERPVHDEDARAAVLSALGSVDMVVMFGGETASDDQTANGLIQKLQPDIYFKGGDYKVDDIPETPTVRQYGGDVKVLSNFEGHSTTQSLEKINKSAA